MPGWLIVVLALLALSVAIAVGMSIFVMRSSDDPD
jgi:hypothetical protein